MMFHMNIWKEISVFRQKNYVFGAFVGKKFGAFVGEKVEGCLLEGVFI